MGGLSLWLVGDPAHSGYDVQCAVVVAAATEHEARAMAAERCGDEGPECWLSIEDCRRIGTAAPGVQPGVLLRDYNAG